MKLIIYIPGLGGEGTLNRQRKIVAKWNSGNTKSVFLEPKWRDTSESFEAKLKRLEDEMKKLNIAEYDKVTFFGTSAGGTLGLNLFSLFINTSQTYFVSICGKIVGPELIGRRYSDPHPALIPSVNYSVNLIDSGLDIDRKKRLLSVMPVFDEVVNNKCMRVTGASHKRQLTLFHVPSIALGLTLFRRRYVR